MLPHGQLRLSYRRLELKSNCLVVSLAILNLGSPYYLSSYPACYWKLSSLCDLYRVLVLGLLKEHLEVIHLCRQFADILGMASLRFNVFTRFAEAVHVLF
jgi:hypothetical protein